MEESDDNINKDILIDNNSTTENRTLNRDKCNYDKNILQTINECLREMYLNDDYRSVLHFMINKILKITENEFGFIAEIMENDGGEKFIRYKAMGGEPFIEEFYEYYKKHFIDSEYLDFYNFDNLFGMVYTENNIIISNDPDNDPRRSNKSKLPKNHPKINRFIGFPLKYNNEVIGIIGLANHDKDYDQNYIQKFDGFISIISAIIVNFRQKMELKRQKDIFLVNMSHEVRTPLNGIIGMGQFLMETKLTSDQEKMINVINRCGLQLLSFVNDLLDFSNMADDKIVFDIKEFSLEESIKNSLDIFKLDIDERNINVQYDIDKNIPKMILHDKQRIQQIIINLLSNAVKSNANTINIQFKLKKKFQSDEKMLIELTIIDNGYGIKPKKLKDIKESIINHSLKFPMKVGTGLGIPISNYLIHKMEGEFKIESEEYIGTTVIASIKVGYNETININGFLNTSNNITSRQIIILSNNIEERIKLVASIISHNFLPLPANNFGEAESLIRNQGFDIKMIIILIMNKNEIEEIFNSKNNKRNLISICRYQIYKFNDIVHIKHPGCKTVIVSKTKELKGLEFIPEKYIIEDNEIDYSKLIEKISKNSIPNKIFEYSSKFDFSSIKILSVEDSVANQKVIYKILSNIGFTNISQVYDGVQFVDHLKEGNQYDIIFIDLKMPRLGGMEAVREIIKLDLKKDMIFIAVTASVTETTISDCFFVGMDSFVSKPIKLEEISNIFKVVFQKKKISNHIFKS